MLEFYTKSGFGEAFFHKVDRLLFYIQSWKGINKINEKTQCKEQYNRGNTRKITSSQII